MNIFKRLFGKKKLEQERTIPRPCSSFYTNRTASTRVTDADINGIIFPSYDYSNDSNSSSSFDPGFGGGDFSGGGAGGSWDSYSSSYDSSNSSGDY